MNYEGLKTCEHCGPWPPFESSAGYERKYNLMIHCPIHGVVSDQETKPYEPKLRRRIGFQTQKNFFVQGPLWGVYQAVGLGRTGQVGIKAFFTEDLTKAVSLFCSVEDARSYLLQVLDTVKREQDRGLRTTRNLDPAYEGGLDFIIAPVMISMPLQLMRQKGWTIPSLSTAKKVDSRRKLTHTINVQRSMTKKHVNDHRRKK